MKSAKQALLCSKSYYDSSEEGLQDLFLHHTCWYECGKEDALILIRACSIFKVRSSIATRLEPAFTPGGCARIGSSIVTMNLQRNLRRFSRTKKAAFRGPSRNQKSPLKSRLLQSFELEKLSYIQCSHYIHSRKPCQVGVFLMIRPRKPSKINR